MWVLSDFLQLKSLRVRVYDRANRIFFAGVVFTGAGVLATIFADFVNLVAKTVG